MKIVLLQKRIVIFGKTNNSPGRYIFILLIKKETNKNEKASHRIKHLVFRHYPLPGLFAGKINCNGSNLPAMQKLRRGSLFWFNYKHCINDLQ